ncbi:MAG: hypothetical protein ACREJC_14840, partial [Tepidisphaeraceae bacterium]
ARVPPARRAMLLTADLLRHLGLLGAGARAYFRLRQKLIRNGDPAPHLFRAVNRIRSTAVYSRTPDARELLSHDNRGDNFVVIAQKR